MTNIRVTVTLSMNCSRRISQPIPVLYLFGCTLHVDGRAMARRASRATVTIAGVHTVWRLVHWMTSRSNLNKSESFRFLSDEVPHVENAIWCYVACGLWSVVISPLGVLCAQSCFNIDGVHWTYRLPVHGHAPSMRNLSDRGTEGINKRAHPH